MSIQQIPIGLYIHLPWCVKKCPYCDFNSHEFKTRMPEQEYITCLLQDFNNSLHLLQDRKIHSIFIGGGTPSLFSSTAIDRLLTEIDKLSPISDIEITMEANPGTFEQKKFQGFYQAGVNRLSIGVQSFSDDKLQSLGRIHSKDEAITAIKQAQEVGFSNLNIDLMYALPQQSLAEAMLDLQTAINLQPEHISWYQLTLEPNTKFYAHPPILPDEDANFSIHQAGIQLLTTAGFNRYEISAFTRKKECVHNKNYWMFGDYLGIGSGAHGKITILDEQNKNIPSIHIKRTTKFRNPKDYLQANKGFVSSTTKVPPQELPFEFMLNALRLTNGFALKLFSERCFLDKSHITNTLLQAEKLGFIIFELSKKQTLIQTNLPENIEKNYNYLWIRITEKGKLFLNDLVGMFM